MGRVFKIGKRPQTECTRPGRSNIRQPGAHEMTENLEPAGGAVVGDGHTPDFENTPWKREVARVKTEA